MSDSPAIKPSVYIETTIVSLLTSRPSRDLIAQANQLMTRDWWADDRPHFDLYTSDFTLDEAGGGDPSAAAERLAAMAGIPLLPASSEAESLAAELVVALALPARARLDAAHVSVCAVAGVTYLLTWNCTHLANAKLTDRIERTCAAAGFVAPRIVTPQQLKVVP